MELLKDYEKDLKRAKAKSISEQWKAFTEQELAKNSDVY